MAVEKKLEDEANALKKQIEEMSELLIKNSEDAETEAEMFRKQIEELKSQNQITGEPEEGPATTEGINFDAIDESEDTTAINIEGASTSGTKAEESMTTEELEELQKAIEASIHEATKEALEWEKSMIAFVASQSTEPLKIRKEWLQPTLPFPLLKYICLLYELNKMHKISPSFPI